MKLYWNFQKCGEVLEKIPSVGEVWIFSGTTQCNIEGYALLNLTVGVGTGKTDRLRGWFCLPGVTS